VSQAAFASSGAPSILGLADVRQEPRRSPADAGRSRVLVLAPAVEHPRPESLKRLEHEYSFRQELDPARAARPIELARHWDRTVLALEDPGGRPLDQVLEQSRSHPKRRRAPAVAGPIRRCAKKGHAPDLAFCLRVGINLANAIGHVHGRGIVHKEIKPANVLVNPATGQVWLLGFGIASRLPRERQSPEPPESIAGTLAYMAPEQTGRMNRSIDSRSDLYSLGVTLYQMATGSLPFTAIDAMEWVQCHVAKQPEPPAQRVEAIPEAVSAMIMKLLAKTAEERYQTATGVESDLRRCLTQWETQGRIDAFALGEHDTPDRLFIPEKLYGREREVNTLLASFDRIVRSGAPELVLVSGYSGIGKSSVVNELHKVLVPRRGFFASGKFDQYKRDIPYSTLAQAFQSLIRRLLGESDTELARWRDALQDALGPNGRLIVDLVPELKLIIGEQPPVPELPPQQAQGRFQLMFRRFIGVFARPEHPLVLFLDDLQWLDAATLDLLEDVLTSDFADQRSSQPVGVKLRRTSCSDLEQLMLIGAYRDNEVDAAHPLRRKLEAIKNAGAKIEEITLAPLAREHLEQFIVDALRCESARAAQLAQLVHEKTGGNPFFAIQFLYALAGEGLLTFDHDAARWAWDLNCVHARSYTNNVVDLMVGKLNRLSLENSDRRKAEEALRASEQRLQDIIDNTTTVIFAKDLELRYLLINREYERRYPVRRDQIRGKSDFDIHPREVAEAVRANDLRVIEDGEPSQFEEVVPTADGKRVYLAIKFLLRNRAGKPYAICGIMTDITGRKRAEELQAQMGRERAIFLEERTRLAGEIHDSLAQNFTGIAMQLDVAKEFMTGKDNDALAYIERANDLARFGLAEARRSVLSLQPTIIKDSGLIESLQLLVERSKIPGRLRCTFRSNLQDDQSLPAAVRQDLLRIAQEAISNALRHATSTAISVTLRQERARTSPAVAGPGNADNLVLKVKDNGRGITTEAETRHGFGFANMRARVQKLNGSLDIRTMPGRGTSIVVCVPLNAGT
jgi:PAS domain S-box-containing protein